MNQGFYYTRCTFGSSKLRDPENISEIKIYENDLDKTRKEQLESLIKSVTEIRSDLENLKVRLSNFNFNEPKNTEYLKSSMLKIENKISSLKEVVKDGLIVLAKSEINLYEDIQFLEKRLEEWSKPINSKILTQSKKSRYKFQNNENGNPIVEFQKFLSVYNGHCGGWEELDHILFVKERKKYKDQEKFFSAIQCLLSDLTYDEILEHEKWYQKYESLKTSKKEAIEKWKAEKKTCQTKDLEAPTEKQEGKSLKCVSQQKNIQERIRKWREQQLAKKAEEEERQKIEKRKLHEEEKKLKQIRQAKKLIVAQYRAQKLQKIQEEIPKQNDDDLKVAELKAKTNILRKSFRMQDIQFIEKKRIMRLQLKSKANDKTDIKLGKPALEILMKRDPQRIFQPTLVWSQRCQQQDNQKEKVTPVFDLSVIPRLAIPEWRRELK